MKKITISYYTMEEKTFNIPTKGKWKKFFDAFFKNEDERTEADWNLLEKYTMNDFLRYATNNVNADFDGILDYE